MPTRMNLVLRAAGVALLVGLALSAGPSRADDLTTEGDLALWCAAIYVGFHNRGAFASAEQDAAARSDLQRFDSVLAAEAVRLGWQQADVLDMSRSYGDEVAPQIDDYLQRKDPAALRLSLADCFPSVEL